jgi:signal transduction histidine kinase
LSRRANTLQAPSAKAEPREFPTAWLAAACTLAGAIGAGVLLAQILMSPPAGDLWTLAAYLMLSGAATMGAGWAVLQVADRAMGLRIQTRAFIGGLIAAAVALLNVVIVAQAMFVSTAHDLKLLIAIVVFSAVITGFFSLLVARAATRKIKPIRDSVARLAGGDLSARSLVDGDDELAGLAHDVNELAQRLREAEEQRTALDRERRELTTAVSHDLRTPLASLRVMVEALHDGVVTEAGEVARYYGSMRREIERLSRMIDDLFELAQIDAGALRLNRATVDLREIAADVADAMQIQARKKRIELSLDCSGDVPAIQLDGARIERALSNLVRNALEYTPPGGTVNIRLRCDHGCVELAVADSGEGIPTEDLSRIWDRFYRGEKSRNHTTENGDGAGLGLAIVRGIVVAHGGTVDVATAPGKGATFTLRFSSRH